MDDRVDIAVLGTKNEAADDAVPRGESGDGSEELADCEVRDERGPEGVDTADVGVTGGRGERGELLVVLELFGEAGADSGGLGEIGPVEDAGLRSLLAAPAKVSELLPLALGSEWTLYTDLPSSSSSLSAMIRGTRRRRETRSTHIEAFDQVGEINDLMTRDKGSSAKGAAVSLNMTGPQLYATPS